MDGEPNRINPEYLLPGTMVGPWEIVDQLGRGGFGVAYKVRRDGRYYALKLTLYRGADLDPDERERHEARVRRECGILLQLNHPNIVRVHGFERWPDLQDGFLYIVMDLVNGQDLYAWRQRAVPSLRRICFVFQHIALALAEAHARGAFHRDIKSENVLVGVDGEPMLIDWGIARSRGAVTITRDHSVMGTHSHFPPEYCRYIDFEPGAEEFTWTPQSELHPVGYMFYELLTGRSPFNLPDEESTSDRDVIIQRLQRTTHAIKTITPIVPSTLNAKVPGSLDQVVMKLLEKDPAARYGSGKELAQALEDALAKADASWDSPFDVPSVAAQAVARTARHRIRPGESQPEMLPALGLAPGEAPVAQGDLSSRRPGTSPHEASKFRPPTVESGPLEPPEHVGESATPHRPVDATEAVRFARETLARRTHAPARTSMRRALLALVGVAALLVGGVLFRAHEPQTKQPESLLRKVETATASNPPVAPGSARAPADDNASSGLPPIGVRPTAPSIASPSSQAILQLERGTSTHALNTASPPSRSTRTRSSKIAARLPAPPHDQQTPSAPRGDDSALEFGQRLGGDPSGAPTGKVPARYHVQTGARIRARLDINLDSRTVSSGPAIARLARAYISDGRVVFPAGTMAYGEARSVAGRFTIKFVRLVLPDKTEVTFEGLAYDLRDRKPGLAPSRRIASSEQPEGTGSKVGKVVANTVLSTVSGGVLQDAARNAAQTTLNSHDLNDSGANGEALLLDSGADIDVLVTKPF